MFDLIIFFYSFDSFSEDNLFYILDDWKKKDLFFVIYIVFINWLNDLIKILVEFEWYYNILLFYY